MTAKAEIELHFTFSRKRATCRREWALLPVLPQPGSHLLGMSLNETTLRAAEVTAVDFAMDGGMVCIRCEPVDWPASHVEFKHACTKLTGAGWNVMVSKT